MNPSCLLMIKFIVQIQLRREMLERWINEPYFEKAVVGYYVRICVGEIEGQNVYRMGEIKGIHKGRKYTLTNKVGNIAS